MFARSQTRHVLLHVGVPIGVIGALFILPFVFQKWSLSSVSGIVVVLSVSVVFGGANFIWKLIRWLIAPIPFRISLTTGQQKSLPSIRHDALGAPRTLIQVICRVVLDSICFRPLLRATPTAIQLGPRLSRFAGYYLWIFAGLFHVSLAVITLRHLRLVLRPVPSVVSWLQNVDTVSDLFLPKVHATNVLIILSLVFLFGRRLVVPRLRYISLAADYFPLLLIGSIAITGIILRHFARVSVGDVKNLLIGIATFSLRTDSSTETLFVVHVLLVCVLLAYFPLSKLMHSAASLISPTLTLVANSREERHVNVFNPSVEVLHYSDYETVFRERMIQAGLPVEEQ